MEYDYIHPCLPVSFKEDINVNCWLLLPWHYPWTATGRSDEFEVANLAITGRLILYVPSVIGLFVFGHSS